MPFGGSCLLSFLFLPSYSSLLFSHLSLDILPLSSLLFPFPSPPLHLTFPPFLPFSPLFLPFSPFLLSSPLLTFSSLPPPFPLFFSSPFLPSSICLCLQQFQGNGKPGVPAGSDQGWVILQRNVEGPDCFHMLCGARGGGEAKKEKDGRGRPGAPRPLHSLLLRVGAAGALPR